MSFKLPLFGVDVTLTPLVWELMDISLPAGAESGGAPASGELGIRAQVSAVAANGICERIVSAAAATGASLVLLEQQNGPSRVSPGNPSMFVLFHVIWHALALAARGRPFEFAPVGAKASIKTCEAIQGCSTFTTAPFPPLPLLINPMKKPTASQRSAYKKGLVAHVFDWIAGCLPGPLADAYWNVGPKRDDMADAMSLLYTHVRLHVAGRVRSSGAVADLVIAGLDLGQQHLSLAVARVRVERSGPPPACRALPPSSTVLALMRRSALLPLKRPRSEDAELVARKALAASASPSESDSSEDEEGSESHTPGEGEEGCVAGGAPFLVYLAWSPSTGATDVGFTSDLNVRLAQYSRAAPSGAARRTRAAVDWTPVCSVGPFAGAQGARDFVAAWKAERGAGLGAADPWGLSSVVTTSRAVRSRLNSLSRVLGSAKHSVTLYSRPHSGAEPCSMCV